MISWSPALFPFRTNQFAPLQHSKTDMIAFTYLQTCWCLLWDQIRGSVWNHQSKALLWPLSGLIYWDPSSSWSQLTEENSTSGIRNHWEKGPTWQQETHVSAVGCMSLLICWRLGMLLHGGLQSSDNLLLWASSSSSRGTTDSGSSGQNQNNTGFKFRNIWISHGETRAGLIGFFCFCGNRHLNVRTSTSNIPSDDFFFPNFLHRREFYCHLYPIMQKHHQNGWIRCLVFV